MRLAKETGNVMDRQGGTATADLPQAAPGLLHRLLTGGQQSADRDGWRSASAAAVAIFLASLVYYGLCMFPG
ncbi:hypothetical protein M8745_20240, partial [Lutimaribacter sp. EGI FJ00014]|nr:hypothetical protein [Lutimaribacter sp. EGI FJ00014]